MKENMIAVKSTVDYTVVINVPQINVYRSWERRGAKYLFDRDLMEQAYQEASVRYLFDNGFLTTDDEEFLIDVGLVDPETKKSVITLLDENLMKRMIKAMPLTEFKSKLAELTPEQRVVLADFAIDNYKDLNMDRVDLLSEASGKHIMKSIENYKAAEE